MKKLLVIGLTMCGGCLGPSNVTVNVFSSRLVVGQAGTNSVRQAVEGGATTSGELGDSAIQAAAEAITGQLPATVDEMVRQYMLSQTNNAPRSTP
jgi:hypothetical protein